MNSIGKKVDNVAIAMPLGRISPWFDLAVESALEQTVDVKIRLIANGLNAKELVKLRDLENRHERIQLHVFDERMPMVQNWNRIFEVVEEEFACALHDDDLLENWAMEELINATNQHPGSGIYHGRERLIDEDGRFHHSEMLIRNGENRELTYDEIVGWAVSNRIWATGFLMNIAKAKECGCYNLRSSFGPDWDLYFLLAAKFGACFVDSHVGRYRLGRKTGQISAAFAKDATNLKECEVQQLHNLEALGLDPIEYRSRQKVGLAHAARATLYHFGGLMSIEGKLLTRKILVEGLTLGRLGPITKIIGERLARLISEALIRWKYPILRKLR